MRLRGPAEGTRKSHKGDRGWAGPNSYRHSKLQLKKYKQQNLMIGIYVLKDASTFKKKNVFHLRMDSI